MRDAAVLRAEIADRRRQVDRPDTAPTQANRRFDIEIEAPHPRLVAHDPLELSDRVDAKPEQGVADAAPQSFDLGPPVGYFAALNAEVGGARVEYRPAQHHRGRCHFRG